MDFTRLPDNVFVKIFKYLPLEDCIRIGRVSKAFRRISQYVTSQTTSLDLTDDRFRNLSSDQLAVVLNLCSPNLKWIYFPIDIQRGVQMATILANYQCHQLVNINLRDFPIDYAVFEQLIRNNPNIERLTWDVEFVGFPNITCNSLKLLKLNVNGDAILQTVIGRCPNLEDLTLITKNITGNVLDQFFASTRQIEKVYLHLIDNQILFQDLVFSWNLPLTYLDVTFDGGVIAEDGILQKVATSFPRLQTLVIEVSNPSDPDIAALAALQELEDLEMASDLIDYHDDGIRKLVACKKLQHLNVSSSIIISATLIALLRGCPQLERVTICAVDDVETPEEAAIILGSLSGITKRDITIEFRPDDGEEDEQKLIWESEVVKEAIRNLEQDEGLKVEIDWSETDGLDETQDDE